MKKALLLSLSIISLNIFALPPKTSDMVYELIVNHVASDFTDVMNELGNYQELTLKRVSFTELPESAKKDCAPHGMPTKSSAFLELTTKDAEGKALQSLYFSASSSAKSIDLCR
jgi:hypothetical protein